MTTTQEPKTDEQLLKHAGFWLAVLIEMGGFDPSDCEVLVKVKDDDGKNEIVDRRHLGELLAELETRDVLDMKAIQSLFTGGVTIVEDEHATRQ